MDAADPELEVLEKMLGSDTVMRMVVEVVHAIPVYASHKAYTRDVLIPQSPRLSVRELATRLNIPLLEAYVILRELGSQEPARPRPDGSQTSDSGPPE